MSEMNETDKKPEVIKPFKLDLPEKSAEEKQADHQRNKNIAGGTLFLLVTLSVGFLGGWLGSESRVETSILKTGSVNQQVILNESQLISEIAKNVGPSVVSVNVISETTRSTFFGFDQAIEQESAGTGIILEDDYVVTNRHVIPAGIKTVSVTLSDGTELTDVEVIGRTNENDPLDIAFLKIKDKKGKDLKPAKIGDSAKVQVGDKVIAIGNALGQFQNTVTSGIISGYGRSVEAGDEDGNSSESLQNLFQTDASINQGNSGGPLLNISGEVIGINTAVAGGMAENIGFAIPVNDVQGLIKSVLSKGKLERPYIGIRYITLTDDFAFQFNLQTKRGVYLAPVRSGSPVLSGSPADKAGLREKDVITKIDGNEINEKNSLISLVSRKSVGEEIELTVVRDGKELKIKLKLEAAPSN